MILSFWALIKRVHSLLFILSVVMLVVAVVEISFKSSKGRVVAQLDLKSGEWSGVLMGSQSCYQLRALASYYYDAGERGKKPPRFIDLDLKLRSAKGHIFDAVSTMKIVGGRRGLEGKVSRDFRFHDFCLDASVRYSLSVKRVDGNGYYKIEKLYVFEKEKRDLIFSGYILVLLLVALILVDMYLAKSIYQRIVSVVLLGGAFFVAITIL